MESAAVVFWEKKPAHTAMTSAAESRCVITGYGWCREQRRLGKEQRIGYTGQTLLGGGAAQMAEIISQVTCQWYEPQFFFFLCFLSSVCLVYVKM